MLPCGIQDDMGVDTVKIFCPKCGNVYHPPPVRSRAGNASGVDGAAFGTTFPHLFLMTFSNLVPDPVELNYVPRIFGFRVHKSARTPTARPAALVLEPPPSDDDDESAKSPRTAEPSSVPPNEEPEDRKPKAARGKKRDTGDGGKFLVDSTKRRRRNASNGT